MIHVDVKKVGRIPDGGGWRVHGKNSDRAREVARHKNKSKRGGYVYLHSAVDGPSESGTSTTTTTDPTAGHKGSRRHPSYAKA